MCVWWWWRWGGLLCDDIAAHIGAFTPRSRSYCPVVLLIHADISPTSSFFELLTARREWNYLNTFQEHSPTLVVLTRSKLVNLQVSTHSHGCLCQNTDEWEWGIHEFPKTLTFDHQSLITPVPNLKKFHRGISVQEHTRMGHRSQSPWPLTFDNQNQFILESKFRFVTNLKTFPQGSGSPEWERVTTPCSTKNGQFARWLQCIFSFIIILLINSYFENSLPRSKKVRPLGQHNDNQKGNIPHVSSLLSDVSFWVILCWHGGDSHYVTGPLWGEGGRDAVVTRFPNR